MQDILDELPPNPAAAAATALLSEDRPILVCTGFPVNSAPETDGPPGAYALIDAFRGLGKKALLASWPQALAIFRKVRSDVKCVEIPAGPHDGVAPITGCAIVTIEICGRCADGSYRNMRCVDIGDRAPRFEDAIGTASLVSVGDGGNEFGMGSAPESFFRKWNVTRPISTTEHLVPASVSNYGAYALIRELELASARKLMPEIQEHLDLIRRLVEAGCVDGYSGRPVATVDGEDLDHTRRLLEELVRI